MGDLKDGDLVLSELGKPCRVLKAHPVELRPRSFRLEFDDGSVLFACADHQWWTFDYRERRALTCCCDEKRRRKTKAKAGRYGSPPLPTGAIRTTEEIARTLKTDKGLPNHAVPVAAPLVLGKKEPSGGPCPLGVRLGANNSSGTDGVFSFIRSCEEVEPRPMRCITVDNPTGLFLVGESMVPTHNSAWLVNDALRMCLAWHGNRVGIFRYELAAFKKTTYLTLREWVLSIPGLVVAHNQQENYIDLVNGSRIVYGGLRPSSPSAGDPFSVVKSLELNAVYIDEVTDVPEKLYRFLGTRVPRVKCRNAATGKMEYPPPRVAATCNPSMGWVKTTFVDQQLPNHIFIRSSVRDNAANLHPEYEEDLRAEHSHDPDWVRRFLEGDWSAAVDYTCIYIAPWLEAARRRRVPPGRPVEFGVDIAAGGSDKTVVVRRRGFRGDVVLAEPGDPDTMLTTAKIAALADKFRPSLIKIDAVGIGKGVFDQLAHLSYPVQAMIGGERADDEGFLNKRAQWYWELRSLLERGMIQLPDLDELINELGDIRYSVTASDRTIQVESKKEIIKRMGHSPDFADAVVYAFAGSSSASGVVSALVGG